MPKVLRIINRLNLGGPTFNAAYLTRYLQPEYETLLVAGMKDGSEASSKFILDKLGITPLEIPEMYREVSLSKDRLVYQKIRQLIREFKPDIVHTHAAKAGAVGRLAAFKEKVPVVLHTFHGHVFHSYFSPLKTRVFLGVERYLAKRSSAIVAISQKQKDELAYEFKICDPAKIMVVPLGFDLNRFQEDVESKRQRFRKKYQVADDEIAIGIIGRLVPIKDHGTFLQSLKKVLGHTNAKIKAFIIGDGESMEAVQDQAQQLDLPFSTPGRSNAAAPLIFTSWIREIDEVNAGMDIIALTSLNEGTPVSLIEAQAAGKPIVSTDVGGVRDTVLPNETAFLSKSGDADEIAQHLIKLIADPELRLKMGHLGVERAMHQYSYQRLVGDMRALYEKLLNR